MPHSRARRCRAGIPGPVDAHATGATARRQRAVATAREPASARRGAVRRTVQPRYEPNRAFAVQLPVK
ncbi:hypothetical protein BLAT2472_10707 [Burkholderia latens]